MWMLLGLLSLAGFPERFELTDQHGTILQMESQPKADMRIVLAADARSVRALAKWVKTKSPDFFELNALCCVVDISEMPEKIKEKRFLPKIRASAIRLFIIDGTPQLDWIPRREGEMTFVTLGSNHPPQHTHLKNAEALDALFSQEEK